MKRLIVISMLLLFPIAASAQAIVIKHKSTSSCPFTDSFPASSGTALNSSNWTTVTASGFTASGQYPVQNSGKVQEKASFSNSAATITGGGCSFPLDQSIYANLVSFSGAGNIVGLLALMTTGGSGYSFTCSVGGSCHLWKYASGSSTLLTNVGTCTLPAAGNNIEISITGSGGTQRVNYSLDTGGGFSVQCYATDNTYTTGNPGIYVAPGSGAATTIQLGPVTAD